MLSILVQETTALPRGRFRLKVSPELGPLASFAHLLGMRLCAGGCSVPGVQQSLEIAAEQEGLDRGELLLEIGSG